MSSKAPLFEKLLSHNKLTPISFHVPGHKMGQGFNPIGIDVFKEILKIDMTEISGLDDLHQPDGVILEAEQRAARVFRAEHTFFLVNGSTTGNIAMIMAVCQPGDNIIVQRNVHKSVIHGIMLARAIPIYISPEIIPTLGIPGSIKKEQLIETLKSHPDAKAVFIMNPNYYGIGIDLTEIIKLIHDHNIPVLIDEAHGAHFGFHPKLPKSSLDMGADIVVQSTHKTLSAMTMGSMLHVKSKYVDIERLKLFLSMVQTSSPSYPIMASLDLTCQLLDSKGQSLWEDILQVLNWFYEKTHLLKSLIVEHKLNEHYYIDPLKIVIHSQYKNISGFYIQKLLEEKNIYTELADLNNTLSIVTYGTRSQDLELLYKGLNEIDDNIISGLENENIKDTNNIQITEELYSIYNNKSKISLEKIIYGKNKEVSLFDSIGKIAAEMVIPYPPGVPVLQLGEEITQEAINYIILLKNNGARFNGVHDSSLNKIKVLEI